MPTSTASPHLLTASSLTVGWRFMPPLGLTDVGQGHQCAEECPFVLPYSALWGESSALCLAQLRTIRRIKSIATILVCVCVCECICEFGPMLGLPDTGRKRTEGKVFTLLFRWNRAGIIKKFYITFQVILFFLFQLDEQAFLGYFLSASLGGSRLQAPCASSWLLRR